MRYSSEQQANGFLGSGFKGSEEVWQLKTGSRATEARIECPRVWHGRKQEIYTKCQNGELYKDTSILIGSGDSVGRGVSPVSRDPLGPGSSKQGMTQRETRPGNACNELEREQWEPLKPNQKLETDWIREWRQQMYLGS